jgi:hypothetical protein
MRANVKIGICWKVALGLALFCVVAPTGFAEANDLSALVDRAGEQVSAFLEVFSEVKCTEHVQQQKLGNNGKVDLKEESTYDYLVILTSAGGELSLDESRLAVHPAKADKKNTPLLVTNGFATLFLVFHPYYAGSFRFSALDDEVSGGRALKKVAFQHIHDTRSPAALSLRGREYPLELSGTAWIDPQSAVITRIEADIGNTMEDLGMKTLHSDVSYAPVSFRDDKQLYWLPSEAMVEVETPRQHWRNSHRFTDYKKFSVSTEEQVAKQQ